MYIPGRLDLQIHAVSREGAEDHMSTQPDTTKDRILQLLHGREIMDIDYLTSICLQP